MASLREQKQSARERLHGEASVEAYYCHGSDEDPIEVTVRVHRKQKEVGDAALGYATQTDVVTSIVFLKSEIAARTGAPAAGAYISVAADEAYRLGAAFPIHGITQEVEAARVPDSQLAALDLPVRE